MAGLLTSAALPTGATRLSDWLADNAYGLGKRYVSELWRNFRLPRQEHGGDGEGQH